MCTCSGTPLASRKVRIEGRIIGDWLERGYQVHHLEEPAQRERERHTVKGKTTSVAEQEAQAQAQAQAHQEQNKTR